MNKPPKLNVTPIQCRWTKDEEFPPIKALIVNEDVFHQHHSIQLSWRDRIRALFGRAIRVHAVTPVRVYMDNWNKLEWCPGATTAAVYVDRIFPEKSVNIQSRAP